MSTRVTGTAFITSSASGIGQKTAYTLAQNDITNLALLDINTAQLQTIRDDLAASFPNLGIEILTADVKDEASVEAAVQRTVARFGGIDIAVHSAGIGGEAPNSDEASLANWQKVIDTNQTGGVALPAGSGPADAETRSLAMTRMEVPDRYRDRGGRLGRGAIVNLSSIFGVSIPPTDMGLIPYTTAKHAVRVRTDRPSVVDTPMTHKATALGLFDKTINQTPMGRCGTLEEIADSILFLVSPMSSYVVGAALVVDGGCTA
ncbi:short chain dehydrogenase/ reductase [Aspergillus campestris IBT 28561]|uniref:Short chain dehydrogenase/ reductase n=1 Tax=Aspergillus campestris (strain IBT 28561) TaxID=1392248 RepID=A0A2I1CQY5_ASPC2|nr:short chain dehydrogenase/ reductase [Aspergillus campestris IBT 28561]PKY00027.1 short chain dehydrogenase/ reductase [Aspergillus campestris IBT 28561]